MKKEMISNFFRKDLQLEKKWWHRSAKIFFVVSSIFVLVTAVVGFYFAEQDNASQPKIIKRFADYIEESKNNCLHPKLESNSEGKDGINFSCYLLVIPSFLQQNSLKDYSLGCSVGSHKVEYLSESSFEKSVECSEGPDYKCTVPQSICGGSALKIVKYEYEIRYQFTNYIFITLKTVGTLLAWVLITLIFYYKGLIYIIFGGRKADAI